MFWESSLRCSGQGRSLGGRLKAEFLVYYRPESEWRMNGTSTDSAFARDILEWNIPEEVLAVLLKDQSTGRNLIWATDDYAVRGKSFGANDEMQVSQIVDKDHPVIWSRDIQAEAFWCESFESRTKEIE